MPDFRCFCDSPNINIGDLIQLAPEESNHLVAANRARVGDPARLFDGKGNEWDCHLTVANKRAATLLVDAAYLLNPPPYKIALAQALPKGKLIETIIKKATEIGIQEIIPITTNRVEYRIDPKKAEQKNAKWAAASLEGAKQSGNSHLVDISPITGFTDLLGKSNEFDLKLIASLTPDARSLKSHWENYLEKQNGQAPRSVLWLVGPEGDFTPEETQRAIHSGFLPTTLGRHVMRSETAAVHALSITQYELENRADSLSQTT